MGFAHQGVWVMGYHGLMGYGVQIPAHQLGGPKMLWDFRGYGLSGAWVMRVSTVDYNWSHSLLGKMPIYTNGVTMPFSTPTPPRHHPFPLFLLDVATSTSLNASKDTV